MHDPNTVAFVIPYGWKNEKFKNGSKWRYWKPLFTIWHRDPERRGNDDSCGWFTPPFNETQREICKILAQDEARDPWFMKTDQERNDDPVLCETLVRGAFHLVSRCLRNRGYCRLAATDSECARWSIGLVHNSSDNFRSSLCFRSGYHSNWYKDGVPNTEEQDRYFREQQAMSFFAAIMGKMLRERRPWFRHPRWHVWHWRVQFHLAQTFKRWAFSRCCKCGKRFSWGYCPGTNSWNSSGPRWFRSEVDVFHGDCRRPEESCLSANSA